MESQELPGKRRVLGRGLNALISPSTAQPAAVKTPLQEEPSRIPQDGIMLIPIAEIVPNPDQPRLTIHEDSLAELAQSISEQGVLQPVVVTRKNGQYQLICGERRLRASRLAGLEKIPAVVKEAAGNKILEMALVENIQREDLNPIEAAQAVRRLVGERGMTQEDLAQKVGKERSTIANSLRLLRLPKEVQDMVANNLLTAGHAKALAGLLTPEHQRVLANRILKENLSVRQTEEITKNLLSGKRSAKRSRRMDPYVQDLEHRLTVRFGTHVRLYHSKKNQGRIEFRYFSLDDLDRILELCGIEKV